MGRACAGWNCRTGPSTSCTKNHSRELVHQRTHPAKPTQDTPAFGSAVVATLVHRYESTSMPCAVPHKSLDCQAMSISLQNFLERKDLLMETRPGEKAARVLEMTIRSLLNAAWR
jgi:hypothetical protein